MTDRPQFPGAMVALTAASGWAQGRKDAGAEFTGWVLGPARALGIIRNILSRH